MRVVVYAHFMSMWYNTTSTIYTMQLHLTSSRIQMRFIMQSHDSCLYELQFSRFFVISTFYLFHAHMAMSQVYLLVVPHFLYYYTYLLLSVSIPTYGVADSN